MKSGPSTERILCGADFTPALTLDEQEIMLKHDPKIRSRSILRKASDDSEDNIRQKKSITFQKFSENERCINESSGSWHEETRSNSVFGNDGELFRRYSFVGNKYSNEYTEIEEDEILIEQEKNRNEEEEKKLYGAKIKILAPYVAENDLPDAFLQLVLKNSADSTDLNEFKKSIVDEIDQLERKEDSDEKKEEERKLTYRQRCLDINKCIELGIVDYADDLLYTLAADRTVTDAAWNHKINVLKKRVDLIGNEEENIEEDKEMMPTMNLHIDNNPMDDDELTDRIIKHNKDKLVKVKRIPSRSDRDIEIFAVKEVDQVCLKKQVETLDLAKPDVARGQLSEILETLKVLIKKIDQKRHMERHSVYSQTGHSNEQKKSNQNRENDADLPILAAANFFENSD
ncbi:unnamed protein product [Oikopleura dioica]|uniref:Uncharacterized protein n=1 Tax=Oikopleura dioica TaxID=34765 RepID=E4XCB0_OIKDI|nr:unnamed protein product [Oikopleura dioica]